MRAVKKVAPPTRTFTSLDFQPLDVDPLDETAASALAKSCYLKINWKISEEATVHDAIKVFILCVIYPLDTQKTKKLIRLFYLLIYIDNVRKQHWCSRRDQGGWR